MKLTVLRSSAGSGKTYALVKEYLRFLLIEKRDDYFRHILALTFTNKATREMKTRILSALRGLSENSNEYGSFKSDLSLMLGLSAKEIGIRATENLSSILHNYGDFEISTIDRFTYRIIRAFSYELNVSPNVEIELNEENLISKAVDNILSRASADNDLTVFLLGFSAQKFREEKSVNLEKDLRELCREINRSDARYFVESLEKTGSKEFLKLIDRVNSNKSRMIDEVKKQAGDLLGMLTEAGIDGNDLYYGSRGVFGFLSQLAKGHDLIVPNNTVMQTLDKDQWTSAKSFNSLSEALNPIRDDLSRGLGQLVEYVNVHLPEFRFDQILSHQLYSMAIAAEAAREVDLYKADRNTALLEDFNYLISKLISNNPIPFIYEKVGERYHHFLIDEFQDTSAVQWYNLLPLIENGLSENYDSLLVGDAKQAIYRWRGGELSQILRLPDSVPQHGQNLSGRDPAFLGHAMDKRILDSNYRSSENIVCFINAFFEKIKAVYSNEIGEIYLDSEQKIKVEGGKGNVEIRFLEGQETEEEAIRATVERIGQLRSLNYPFSDIAVLCRKGKQCGMIADALLREGIPIVSVESLKLNHSPRVNFLTDWIHYLYMSRDESYGFRILRYLAASGFTETTDADLLRLWTEGKSFTEIIGQMDNGVNIKAFNRGSIYETVLALSDHFFDENEKDRYLVSFEDCVLQFQLRFGSDAIEFISWWNDNGDRLSVEFPDSGDAVNILTIHKAKGLEFKAVIIPFTTKNIRPTRNHVWTETMRDDRSLMEYTWLPVLKSLSETRYANIYEEEMKASFTDELNLLYVGLTRARQHLTVISGKPGPNAGKYNLEKVLSYALDLNDLNQCGDPDSFCMTSDELAEEPKPGNNEAILNYAYSPSALWRERTILKYRSENRDLSAYRDVVEEGIVIHKVLSEMFDISELPEIINKYSARGEINQSSAASLTSQLADCLSDSRIRPYFENVNGEVFNEREIMDETGNRHRPDRCVISGNEAVLFDYKTGMPDSAHVKQMKNYGKLYSELGYDRCRGYLIYFSNGDITEVI